MTNSHSRVALVTGGGSGIGASVAEALVKDDWDVVIAGRRQEALDSFIRSHGNQFSEVNCGGRRCHR
jgi:NAD(P)-dependent dehydrogenase (short-subunit alcohol dehydrogenase family)